MTKKELEDMARCAINAYIWAEAETDAADSEAMTEWAVRSLDSWYESAERETAALPTLLRVAEAAGHLLATLNYCNKGMAQRYVGGFLFDDGKSEHANIADLRAALAALEASDAE